MAYMGREIVKKDYFAISIVIVGYIFMTLATGAAFATASLSACISFLILIFTFYKRRNIVLKITTTLGTILVFVGYIFNIIAPGNQVRASYFNNPSLKKRSDVYFALHV